MKSKRIYPAFTISKKGEMSLKNGHPWVYCDELRNEPEGLKNGELCDVFSEKGSYLGTGFLSLNSKIRIRILSDNANENFSENFFRRRIRYAIDYRKTVMGDDFSACRLLNDRSLRCRNTGDGIIKKSRAKRVLRWTGAARRHQQQRRRV